MEDQAEKLIENFWKHADYVPVDVALAWFTGHIDHKCRSKNILLDARVANQPGRNKNWEIELLFVEPDRQCRREFFACHESKHFTSYSITLGSREFWFDRYDCALSFLQFEDN